MNIPENKQWNGMLPGNYAGNLWQTWNIDLEKNPGRVSLSNHMTVTHSATEGKGVIDKLIRTKATATDQWFAITSGDILRSGTSAISGDGWITDNTAGTFNDPRDMEIHESANGEDRLVCTREAEIAILNSAGTANAWDDNWGSAVLSLTLTTQTYHPIAKFQRLLIIGDKQAVASVNTPVIHTIDKDDTVSTSKLIFPAEYTVRHIITTSDKIWIALQHDFDGKARIIQWDGFSSTYNKEYDLSGTTPLTGFVVNDVPHFITEKGYIFRFTGGGFIRVQSFHIDEEQATFGTALTNEATIKPYGVWVDGDIVYINVSAPLRVESSATTVKGARRARSGIWIYNTTNNNLYHHRGLGERVNAGNRSFGSPLLHRAGTVIKTSIGGVQVLLASVGIYTGGATWITSTQSVLLRDNSPTTTALNRGYIITPFLPIKEIDAMWEALWVKFKKFVDSGNRIIVKWRTTEPLEQKDSVGTNNEIYSPLQAAATWATTTTFTCVVPTGVKVGDEVEVLSGDNAGCSFNISTLSGTPDGSSTLTVTIDEATPFSSTDTIAVRFDNFRSETAISSTTIGNQRVPFTSAASLNAGNLHGEFVQLKIELRGMDTQLDELIPVIKSLTNPKQG